MRYELAAITGATGGLGTALARALSARRTPLLLSGRDPEKLKEFAAGLDVPTILHVGDLSIERGRATLIELFHQYSPDLIINNAGFGLYGDALTHSLKEELEMIDLNVTALIALSIEGARSMIGAKKQGVILNISSAASFFIYPAFATYAATKSCVNSFSRSFDQEVARDGVRVLTCCPGPIHTNFQKRASHGRSPKKKGHAMNGNQAAALILQQADARIPFQIIDARYKWFFRLSYLVPSSWISWYLRRQKMIPNIRNNL